MTEIYRLSGMKSFRDDLIDRMKTGWGRFVLASYNQHTVIYRFTYRYTESLVVTNRWLSRRIIVRKGMVAVIGCGGRVKSVIIGECQNDWLWYGTGGKCLGWT